MAKEKKSFAISFFGFESNRSLNPHINFVITEIMHTFANREHRVLLLSVYWKRCALSASENLRNFRYKDKT